MDRVGAWSFEVHDSFEVAGRGTAVVGILAGDFPPSPVEATLIVDGELESLAEVWLEFVLRGGEEHPALLLRGIHDRPIPRGSVVAGS